MTDSPAADSLAADSTMLADGASPSRGQGGGESRFSILTDGRLPEERDDEPDYFDDLHLDQVVGAITAGLEYYRLPPLFQCKLTDSDSVMYRQEVFRDLENPGVARAVRAYCDGMSEVRHNLEQAGRDFYRYPAERWFLEAVDAYCLAVTTLGIELHEVAISSRGLRSLSDYLDFYVDSSYFSRLRGGAVTAIRGLESIDYSVRVNGTRVTVRRHEPRPDYSEQVLATFSKFQQGEVKDYRVRFRESIDLNHVEAAIVDMVARLYPEEFQALDDFFQGHQGFIDPTLEAFDREVHFYLGYRDYTDRLTAAGLSFCYPTVSYTSKEVFATDAFDLALATGLVPQSIPVVTNDFRLEGVERVILISGPNQGGKTTLARTFGQLHHLASLGCPVPGTSARLFLFDGMFTHFEREEDLSNLTGKLEDDLLRIRDILIGATPSSIVIINEIFTSTTFDDARFLSKEVMEKLVDLDVLCVMVSFIDELAAFGDSVVSMVSTVNPSNPAERTFKVLRMPADGLAYAAAIAQKYSLTYGELKKRVAR